MKSTTIIGWDAASEVRKNAFCIIDIYDIGKCELKEVFTATVEEDIECLLQDYIEDDTILAIDIPLAWPFAYQQSWNSNSPNNSSKDEKCVCQSADEEQVTFKRVTERHLSNEKYINPLEVTSQPIAKAAYKTHQRLNKTISEEWFNDVIRTPNLTKGILEVYPAASLQRFQSIPKKLPKKDDQRYNHLAQKYTCSIDSAFEEILLKTSNNHEIDAVVCAATAIQYLNNQCEQPGQITCEKCLAAEGWIWVNQK